VAEIMLMNFTTVAMDQIAERRRQAALHDRRPDPMPLVIRTTTGAGLAPAASTPTTWKPGSPTPPACGGACDPGGRLRPDAVVHLR
jgi:hypothetical protein